jgi:hypothetical protein
MLRCLEMKHDALKKDDDDEEEEIDSKFIRCD